MKDVRGWHEVTVRLCDEPEVNEAYELLVHFRLWFLDNDLVDFVHETETILADLFEIEEVDS